MFCLNSCAIVLGIIAQIMHATTQLTQCVSEFCFTISDNNQTRTFDEAKSWCINNSSTLAVINDQRIQDALTSVLSSLPSPQPELMFINAKLQQIKPSWPTTTGTWFLLNGTNYYGTIVEQDPRDAEYRYYMYVQNRNGDNKFNAYASNPLFTKNYVCEYDENMCSNVSSNSGISNYGRCYVKYDNENVTWYKARERCKNNGGDIMIFPRRISSSEVSSTFNTSWLNPSSSYWVGIRWNNRTWFSSDNGPEIVYTNWSRGEPNNSTFECVCVDPHGNPNWSWIDCDCNIQRQFLCFKIVPTTTPAATTIPASVSSSTLTPGTVANSSRITNIGNDREIALGVGIGVGGFIVIIIVVIVVVIVVVMKKRKNASTREQSNEVNKTVKTKTSNKDLVKEEKNGDDSAQMYATVLSSTLSKEAKESPGNTGEVVYTQPEFFGTVKSESPYSDSEDSVTSRSRNDDVVSKTRTRTLLPSSTGDIYANVDGEK